MTQSEQSLDTPHALRQLMRSLERQGSSQQITVTNSFLQAELAYQHGELYHVSMMTANGPLEGDTAVVQLLNTDEHYPARGVLQTVPIRTTVNVRNTQETLLSADSRTEYPTTPLTTAERLERLKTIMARKSRAAVSGDPVGPPGTTSLPLTAPHVRQDGRVVTVERPDQNPAYVIPENLNGAPGRSPPGTRPPAVTAVVSTSPAGPVIIPDDAPDLSGENARLLPAELWAETQRVMTATIGPAAMMLMSRAARDLHLDKNAAINVFDARRLHTALIAHVPAPKRANTARNLAALIDTQGV